MNKFSGIDLHSNNSAVVVARHFLTGSVWTIF